MRLKAVSGIMLTLLLIGILTLAFSIQRARASEARIYIKADGSVDPPYAPIHSDDNVTYYFTDSISRSEGWLGLGGERNNIVLDGNGYTLEADYSVGIVFSGLNNVTIQNMDIYAWYGGGIHLSNVNNITVQNTTIDTAHGDSISLSSSTNNTISGNTLHSYLGCLRLVSSSFNTISGNRFYYYESGPQLFSSSNNNTISRNNITDSVFYIHESSNNTISENTITNNSDGIYLYKSSNNIISGNNITNSHNCGIKLGNSSDNKFYHNNFDNTQNIYDLSWEWPGYSPSINIWDDGYPSRGNYWNNYVGLMNPIASDVYSGPYQNETGKDGIGDTSYVIDGNNRDNYPVMDAWPNPPWVPISSFHYAPLLPIVYEMVTFNASAIYDADGYIVSYIWDFGDETTLAETEAITTHGYDNPGTYTVTLNVTDNDGLTDIATKSITIGKMPTSISISTSSPSSFVGFKVNITGTLRDMYENTLRDETVVLYYTFSGIIEWVPITSDTTDNFGNYQAIWIPPATGYFVIKARWAGNTTHSEASNTTTLSNLAYQDQYVFSVESNSTISELAFDTKNWKLSFAATGPNGTRGYVKVTVARSLVANITNIRVFLDGRELEFTIASTDDSWLLTFTYEHSVHQVEVKLDITVTEDTTPPAVSILSPENKTYAVKDVPLTFTVDETTSWIGYSLDGQANVTITGNITLTSLLGGSHHVVVFANDTAGNMGASNTVHFTVDTTPPNITDVSQTPLENNVLPEDEVKVNATVIDVISGVKKVTLNYTNGNGTWMIVGMTNLEGNIWNATIPSFPYGTNVTYVILAEDNAGNTVTSGELGYEYQYQVITEFPSFLILPLLVIATLLAVIVYKRKHSIN